MSFSIVDYQSYDVVYNVDNLPTSVIYYSDAGKQVQLANFSMTYDIENNPIYLGETLYNHSFCITKACFEVNPESHSLEDQSNSTTVVLAPSATFTGNFTNTLRYAEFTCLVSTDVAGTLLMDISTDGVNVDRTKTVDMTAGGVHTLVVVSKFMRIRYTNGTSGQSYLRIQTILHRFKSKNLTSTLEQSINDSNDVELVRAVIASKNAFGTYENVNSDEQGRLQVVAGSENIFGETIVTKYVPIVQNYNPYGTLNSQLFTLFTGSGGTVTAAASGAELVAAITTSVGSFAVLRSRRALKYRPGYSSTVRFSMVFDTGVPLSLQFGGVGNAGSDCYFAMDGTTFGIRRSTNGLAECRTLTITAPENTAATASVELDGTTYNVPLTDAGGDIYFTAFEIANFSYAGWITEQIEDKVNFLSENVGSRPASYTYSSTGASTGTIVSKTVGVALTTTFVDQASWNGPSIMKTSLDPTQRNMYEISYSWYGVGNIEYKVLNPASGRYELVHRLTFANTTTELNLSQPNMFLQNGLASLGSTTAMTVNIAGNFGAILGEFEVKLPIHGVSIQKTIQANTETNIMVLKNRLTVNAFPNQSEFIIRNVSIIVDGNKPVEVKFIKLPTSVSAGSTSDYTNYVLLEENLSLTAYDTQSITRTGGDIISEFFINRKGEINRQVDLQVFQKDVLVISCVSESAQIIQLALTIVDDL